jgi:hypothetical protein
MTRLPLTPDGRPTPLEAGYVLRAPGLEGDVQVFVPRPGAPPSRASAPATPELEAAFAATDVVEAATVAIDAAPAPLPPGTRTVRSSRGEEALELEVPALGPRRGQMVLCVAENGVTTWHFPEDEGAPGGGAATTRGGGPTLRFVIPSTPAPSPEGPATHRGFVGALGRRLLKVLVYPVTDALLARAGSAFAAGWEAEHRPYRVRTFTPEGYTRPSEGELDGDDWARLAGGRALLFVHGTFATSHGAFGELPGQLMTELHHRYDGRVFAVDTPTLSEGPGRNAAALLDRIPSGLALDLDVVCHSRGGLVTRELAAQGRRRGAARVRRAVFVGAPNAGTALADPDHMAHMLDRFTSALLLLPGGGVTEVLEGVVTAVKVVGRGVVGGLPGIAAMRPDGDVLAALASAPGPDDAYAVTADYEPEGATLGHLIRQRVADGVMDRIFRGEANDLVVPTDGVFQVEGGAGFPLPAERVHRFAAGAGIAHTSYFAAPETAAALARWLRA